MKEKTIYLAAVVILIACLWYGSKLFGLSPENTISGLLGAVVALLSKGLIDSWVFWSRSAQLSISEERAKQSLRIRVHNRGTETIQDAVGYITMDSVPDDVIDVPGRYAYIGNGHKVKIDSDRICWAVPLSGGSNAFKLDICPGERAALDVAQIHEDKTIIVPSELGFGRSEDERARAFLNARTYAVTVQIVGKNILPHSFTYKIGPELARGLQELKEIDHVSFTSFLKTRIPFLAGKRSPVTAPTIR